MSGARAISSSPMFDRESARAVLRWMLGGAALDAATFMDGMAALPEELHPLAAWRALAGLEGLPNEARRRLTEIERAAHVAWMTCRTAINHFQTVLETHGIDYVLLKGAALAEQVYPHPATRPMTDVDVWVGEDDLARAIGALTSVGFIVPPRHDDPAAPRRTAPEGRLERRVAGGAILFELHTRPKSFDQLPATEIEALRANRVAVGRSGLPALRLDAQLLHVCLHATRSHGCVGSLRSLVDMGWIVRAWPHDSLWEDFTALVRNNRAATAVHVSLALARSDVGASVPDDVLERLASPRSHQLVERARDLAWCPAPRLPRGTLHLAGWATEPTWLRNRLRLRVGAVARGRDRTFAADRPGARLVLRYFVGRAVAFARIVLSGQMLRRSFWRRVASERRRQLWLRDLHHAEDSFEMS